MQQADENQSGEARNVVKTAQRNKLPKRRVTVVELPGYVSEGGLDRALSSFGGEDAVAQALSTRGSMLPLRLRPGDASSHAIFGDPTLTTSFLLRVPKGPQGQVSAEILAKIPVSYTFSGMADFQYVNVKEAQRRAQRRTQGESKDKAKPAMWDDDLDPTQEVDKVLNAQAQDELYLVPPIFSKIDQPQEYNFKQTSYWEGSKGQRNSFFLHMIRVSFEKRTPTETSPTLLEDQDFVQSNKESAALLSDIFQSRPVWSQASLRRELLRRDLPQSTDRALPLVAYVFSRGPFRRLYARIGYDPRQEPSSMNLQIYDFRIPAEFFHASQMSVPKMPPGGKAGGPMPYRRGNKANILASNVQDGGVEGGVMGGEEEDGVKEEAACGFETAPTKKQVSYQLVDIVDEDVEEIMRSAVPESSCSERHGWLSKTTVRRLNFALRARYRRLIGAPPEVAKERVGRGAGEEAPGVGHVKSMTSGGGKKAGISGERGKLSEKESVKQGKVEGGRVMDIDQQDEDGSRRRRGGDAMEEDEDGIKAGLDEGGSARGRGPELGGGGAGGRGEASSKLEILSTLIGVGGGGASLDEKGLAARVADAALAMSRDGGGPSRVDGGDRYDILGDDDESSSEEGSSGADDDDDGSGEGDDGSD